MLLHKNVNCKYGQQILGDKLSPSFIIFTIYATLGDTHYKLHYYTDIQFPNEYLQFHLHFLYSEYPDGVFPSDMNEKNFIFA